MPDYLLFKQYNSSLSINTLCQVCDKRGDPCDALCGGAGCGTCGELSCNEGLVQISRLTLKFSNDAETTLKRKEIATDDLLRGISGVRRQSDDAGVEAQMAYDESLKAKNETDTYKFAIEELLMNITEYFNSPAATPEGIRRLAEEVGQYKIEWPLFCPCFKDTERYWIDTKNFFKNIKFN